MKLRREREEEDRIIFEGIEPFFLDLLRRLPGYADPGDNAAARARLYSAPMARGSDGDEFNEDWERYVEPEIRALFRTAQDTVAMDLAALPGTVGQEPVGIFEPGAFESTGLTMEVPFGHAEAWLSVLNQARLVIAARRGFGERELDEDAAFPPVTERDMDLFRVNFYAELQYVFLREMGF